MVVFSCEVCNDTVIKKKLEQHTRVCRGAYFTCIDCSTTFQGNSFRSHITCISESEKYEKNLFKGKKQGSNHQIIKNCEKSIISDIQTAESKSKKNRHKSEAQETTSITKLPHKIGTAKKHKRESLDIKIEDFVNKRLSLNKVLKKIAKKTKQDKKNVLHNIFIWKDDDGKIIID